MGLSGTRGSRRCFDAVRHQRDPTGSRPRGALPGRLAPAERGRLTPMAVPHAVEVVRETAAAERKEPLGARRAAGAGDKHRRFAHSRDLVIATSQRVKTDERTTRRLPHDPGLRRKGVGRFPPAALVDAGARWPQQGDDERLACRAGRVGRTAERGDVAGEVGRQGAPRRCQAVANGTGPNRSRPVPIGPNRPPVFWPNVAAALEKLRSERGKRRLAKRRAPGSGCTRRSGAGPGRCRRAPRHRAGRGGGDRPRARP